MSEKFKIKKYRKEITIAVAYLIITAIFTWPLLPNIFTKVTDTGDPFFISWVINSGKKAILGSESFWNQNIFYPYLNTMAFSDHSLTLTLQFLPLSFFTQNPIFIVNYTQFLGFFLSAVFAYLLVFFYTKDRKASFLGGFVYAFSAYHIGQISHLQISSYQYIPLTILTFESFLKKQNLRSGLFFSGAFLLNAFVSVYHLAYALIPLTIIFFFRFLSKYRNYFNKKFIFNSLISIILISIPLLFLYIPYLNVSENFNIERTADDLVAYSARYYDFFVTPYSHPILGSFSKSFFESKPNDGGVEHTLFLGVFTLAIASMSFFAFKKRKIKINATKTNIMYGIIFLVTISLSFGPEVNVLGVTVPLPFKLLNEYIFIFKAIRVPTRVMIIGILSLSVLVGLVVKRINESSRKNLQKYKNLVFIVIFLLIAIEQFSAPLKMHIPQNLNQETFEWIDANLGNDNQIIHFPLTHQSNIQYMRYSYLDNHRMFNGYSGIFPESTERMMDSLNSEKFLTNPEEDLAILATIGIDYFVLHEKRCTQVLSQVDCKGLRKALSKMETVSLAGQVEEDIVFDIRDLKNQSYFETQITIEYQNDQLLQRNNSTNTWVSNGIEIFEIPDWKEQKDIFKPLYLKPGEEVVVEF